MFLSSDDDDIDYEALIQNAEKPRRDVIPPPPAQISPPAIRSRIIVNVDLVSDMKIRMNYHPETELICRRFKGTQVFNNQGSFWEFPIGQFRPLISALQSPSNPFTCTVDATPESILKAMLSLRPKPTTPRDLEHLPGKLLSKLMMHQRESVLFALARGFRVFVADDMGLGKTIEAIACACAAGFPNTLRLLVLAPPNLVSGWVESFLQWTNVWQSSINIVTKNERLADTPLTIVSYTAGVRVADKLKEIPFDMIILDESHELKNQKTQTYKSLSPVITKSKYLILLSGTPTMNRPAELFSQLKLLLPSVFWSFKEYAVRYCRGRTDAFGRFECTGCTHSDELKTVLEHLVMIRRQKEDVLYDLPMKRRFHTKIEFNPSRELQDMVSTLAFNKITSVSKMTTTKQEDKMFIARACTQTAKEKLPAVLNWLCSSEFRTACFTENRKCLIFAHHLVLLNGIGNWLTEQEVGCICITGSTPRDQREISFARFRSDPECRIAVLSIEIASAGLTLTEATLVVFAELVWTPADHQQAEDRVHRIGQTRDVIIHYLHAEGSADDRIWDILEKKLVMISSVINSSTTTFES